MTSMIKAIGLERERERERSVNQPEKRGKEEQNGGRREGKKRRRGKREYIQYKAAPHHDPTPEKKKD